MKKFPDISELISLVSRKQTDDVRALLVAEHPHTIAEKLSACSPQEMWTILRNAPYPLQGEIFSHFEEDIQIKFILGLKKNESASILSQMPHDDRAKLFRRLSEDEQNQLYPALTQAEREDIRMLSSYPKGSAGRVSTSDYLSFPKTMTVSQALDQIRREAPSKETIYYSYVVDDDHKLIGFVSLKKLILSDPHAILQSIMHEDMIYARINEDQEEAANKIKKYDLIALPVVSENDTLIGIITYDDAMDIVTQEQQEDIEKLMAIQGAHKAGTYLKTPSWLHYKNRVGWIIVLAMVGILSGVIMQSYESVLSQFLFLALYMPMLADTGGNIGSQSSTVVIRALAIGEIQTKDYLMVLFKEFKISLLLACSLAIFTVFRVLCFSKSISLPDGVSLLQVGGVISLALGLQVLSSSLIGTFLPLLVSKCKKDPALIASPALTTLVDITGLIIYFSLAKWLLQI